MPALLSSDPVMIAAEDSYSLDCDLASRLYLLYHPKLLVGRFCPDASPASVSGKRGREGRGRG